MTNPLDLGFARTAHRLVQQADNALNLMARSEQRALLMIDILAGLHSHERRVIGYPAECLQERARILGTDFDPRFPVVPWATIKEQTRAPLAAGLGGAGGGYLVATETEDTVIDILRPESVVIQSGAPVYENLQNHAIFPRLVSDITGSWLQTESTSATEQPPVFGGAAVTPKTWGFTVRWSRQLALQAPNMEAFLRTIARRAAGQALDVAALNGSGSAGTPLGLLSAQGLATQSGAAYSHANSLTTRATLANANTADGAVSWIGHPGVRTILGARERNTGDEYVWNIIMDQITGRKASVSTAMPSATLVAGDWSNLCYCLFGDGFTLDSTQFNSASDFASGISAMRLMVSADIFLQRPAAFVAVTSVS
jgi:HK97 family phage major capsid protein